MFFGSLLVGFFITSSLLVNTISDIKPSIGKFYSALWMALWMVLIMLDYRQPLVLGIVTALIIVFWLVRKQVLISEREYLKAMIQHHSSAILTSEQILEKTTDSKVRKLATWIKDSQQREIDYMETLL